MSANLNYMIGSVSRISVAITSGITGIAADPGGLVLKIRPPNAAMITLLYGVDIALVRDSFGLYHADLDLTQPGRWRWRWEAAAPNQGASEGALTVTASGVL